MRTYDNVILNEKRVNLERLDRSLKNYFVQYYNSLCNPEISLPGCESSFRFEVEKQRRWLKENDIEVKKIV